MLKVFRLPDLGEGLTESEIVAWYISPGDTVTLNQHIADVETAKAVVELPSPFSGVVSELHQTTGVIVQVGEPIVSFDVADAAGASSASAGGSAPSEAVAAPEAREANLVGYGPAVERGGRPARRSRPGKSVPARSGAAAVPVVAAVPAAAAVPVGAAVPAVAAVPVGAAVPAVAEVPAVAAVPEAAEVPAVSAAPEAPAVPAVAPAVPAAPVAAPASRAEPAPVAQAAQGRITAAAPALPVGERPRSTPPVRALARDLGVDLEAVMGTGPDGLIIRDDVRAAQNRPPSEPLASVASSVASSTAASVRESRTPIKSLRKHTAAAMVQSAFTAPHVTEFLTVDVTPTMELLDSLKSDRAFAGQRISILTVVAKAVCIAIARTPSVNARWDDGAGEIVQFHYVNLGIAAATPRGLLVPNIPDAHLLGLGALAAALAELTAAARAGTTTPASLGGGTITITNIGVFGIDAGTPILNPGEAAILAMGAIRRMPWEHRGEVALRQVLTLSLSFDHRLVDGEQGSTFLADVGTILANPAKVLTMI